MSDISLSPDDDSDAEQSDMETSQQDVQEDGALQPQNRSLQADGEPLHMDTSLQAQDTQMLPLNVEPYQHNQTEAVLPLYRDGEDERVNIPDWFNTPEVVLTNILRMLPVIDRLNMSRVCCKWQAATARPSVWQVFDYGVYSPADFPVHEPTKILEVRSAHQEYLHVVEEYGDKLVCVHVVLYCEESLLVLKKLTNCCRNVRYCSVEVCNETRVNLPKLVDLLAFFLSNNNSIQELCLKNVHFKEGERYHIVPDGCLHSKCMQKLSLINSFTDANVSQLTYLVNLSELTVSPLQLRYTWLSHLTKSSLHTLNIVGDLNLLDDEDGFRYPSELNWRKIVQSAQFQVKCYGVSTMSPMLCPEIPVTCLACYDMCYVEVGSLLRLMRQYSETLNTFISFTSFVSSRTRLLQRPTDETPIISIVQKCSKLTSLAVTTRLYSSTVLLMIQLNSGLRDLTIREDLIDYQLHIPPSLNVTDEVRSFTEKNFSREMFVSAMSHLLQRKWYPLHRTEFSQVLHRRYFDW